MTCVRVVCDANFKKSDDVDKSVAKVLKMFSDHFVEKTAPLNKDSDMECVYVYDDLTPEQVRILKKLLNQNKTLLNFKELVISKPGDKKKNTKKKKKKKKKIKSVSGSWSVGTSSDPGSVTSEDSENSENSEKSEKSEHSDNSKSTASSSSTSSSVSCASSSLMPKRARKAPKAPKAPKKSKMGGPKIAQISEITRQLRELADELENI